MNPVGAATHKTTTVENELAEFTSPTAEFLYLDQSAVLRANVLDMSRAFDVIENALRLYEKGKCVQPHKVVLREADNVESEELGRFNALFASMQGPNPAVGMKWIGSFPANRAVGLPRASAVVILNSPATGLPIAILDGTIISAMRTGAVTGLGVRRLAPSRTRKVAVIGAGVQARTQILGLLHALPQLEQIAVFSRCPAQGEQLKEDCQLRWQAPISVAHSVSAALADADVVLPITTSSEPVISAKDIKPGALTVQLSGHECEFDLVRQCRKVVTDNWEVLKHRGISTLAVMHRDGLLKDEDIYCSLGQLLLGEKAGRESDDERIHFAHMGMGVEDIALASDIYRTALDNGIGQWLKLWEKPLWV